MKIKKMIKKFLERSYFAGITWTIMVFFLWLAVFISVFYEDIVLKMVSALLLIIWITITLYGAWRDFLE